MPVLRRALAATGEQANACVQANSTTCLTYAYALYDLGRALRLSGQSGAAVPVLEARLQIDNQRPWSPPSCNWRASTSDETASGSGLTRFERRHRQPCGVEALPVLLGVLTGPDHTIAWPVLWIVSAKR